MQPLINKPGKCADCGTALPVPRNVQTTRCKPCQKVNSRLQARAAGAKWRAKTKAENPDYFRQAVKTRTERVKEQRRIDPEFAERQRQYIRESKARKRVDPEWVERRRAYQTQWARDNAGRMSELGKISRDRLRLATLTAYGGKCACCGESRNEFLAIDHVNGGGNEHRRSLSTNPRGGAGQTTYRWLRRAGYPPGFQVLCHNCNMARGFYGHCPHTLGN